MYRSLLILLWRFLWWCLLQCLHLPLHCDQGPHSQSTRIFILSVSFFFKKSNTPILIEYQYTWVIFWCLILVLGQKGMQWSDSSFGVLVVFSVSFRSGLITQWSHSSACLGVQQSQVIPPWAPSISTCRNLCLVPACPFLPHDTEHLVHDPQSDHLQFTVNHKKHRSKDYKYKQSS